MLLRLASPVSIVLAMALMALAGCAAPRAELAEGYGPAGVVIDRKPLPFDPAPLPPNVQPGDCLARLPQGWLRAECRTLVAGRDRDGYLTWPGKDRP